MDKEASAAIWTKLSRRTTFCEQVYYAFILGQALPGLSWHKVQLTFVLGAAVVPASPRRRSDKPSPQVRCLALSVRNRCKLCTWVGGTSPSPSRLSGAFFNHERLAVLADANSPTSVVCGLVPATPLAVGTRA